MTNSKYLQSQCNSIKAYDNLKHSLTQIKKIQHIVKFRISTINEITLLIKTIAKKKRLDIYVRKMSYITN